MGNITGSPFRTWVTEQINARQKALGQYSNIDPKNLLYYTTKTPWIRLASSVDLNNGKVLNFGQQYAIRFIVEHFNENFSAYLVIKQDTSKVIRKIEL